MSIRSAKPQRHEDEIYFYTRQNRVVLKNCLIEPDNIEEYIYKEGYQAARKALTEMSAEQICQTIIDAGLRGRGGGGFPTGLKWKFTLASKGDKNTSFAMRTKETPALSWIVRSWKATCMRCWKAC